MRNKRDIKVFIFPVLIFFAFLFSIIGYKQVMGAEFSLPKALYSIITFFAFENIRPEEISSNVFLLIGRYLAAVLLGFGIYSLLYNYISAWYVRLKIKYNYRGHVIVFSTKVVGRHFLQDLVAHKYKVVLVEPPQESNYPEKIETKGVLVFRDNDYGEQLFDGVLLSRANACVIALDDDGINIDLTLKAITYLQKKQHKGAVKILPHIKDPFNLEVMRDHTELSKADENFELDIFNVYSAAAKKIYDHFPPHNYFSFDGTANENAIAVIGYNRAAEDFLVENIILSHYKDCRNIKIYLVDREADIHLNDFMYKYPFYREFAELIPVKLLNSKFFANFNWSKELIEKLSKVKAAYFFGNDGAELINTAQRLRQFFYGQTLNYMQAPIVICFPEDTSLINLMDAERQNAEKLSTILNKKLNINFVYLISDTCTTARLLEEREHIDLLSRIINYYYAIKYEFEAVLKEKLGMSDATTLIASIEQKLLELADKSAALSEKEVEHTVIEIISSGTHKPVKELSRHLFSV